MSQILIFIVVANMCAGLNVLASGYREWRDRLGLPGRSIYWAGLAAILLGWWFWGGWGALAGASFLGWRLPGWYGAFDAGFNADPPEKSTIFGRVVSNQRLRDFIVMSARGLLFFPVFCALAWHQQSMEPLVWLLAGSLAQGWAYDFGWWNPYMRALNGSREMLAGGAWGAVLYAALYAVLA